MPRVVYVPLSYDPDESIRVSIKTLDEGDPTNPLAGVTVFSGENSTRLAGMQWCRFADKTSDEPLSARRTYWLIITPQGNPGHGQLGEIKVADMVIPVADVYLGGHRSHFYGGWTHCPDQNDLLFKIYGEELQP